MFSRSSSVVSNGFMGDKCALLYIRSVVKTAAQKTMQHRTTATGTNTTLA